MRFSLARLSIVAALLFQSHWVDDVGTPEKDVAGIVVGLAGGFGILAGLLAAGTAAGRIVLALALAFVIWVSIADLIGLGADGVRATDVVAHWTTTLGWPLTAVVAMTLVAAGAASARLAQGRFSILK